MAKTEIEAEVKTNIGDVASEMSVMGVSLNSMKAGFKAVGKAAKMAFGTMKAAIMSTGIGALLIAMLALRQYFTDNEKGASKLKAITAAFGVVIGNLTDILSDFGEKLFNAFSNPKQAVADLWEAIKKNLMNRLTGIVDSFKAVGKIIEGVFDLDWDAVKEGSAEFGESMVQVVTGVDDLFGKATEAVKEFGAQTRKEVNMAIQLEKDRLALQQFERKASVDKAKTEKDMMELRLKARDFEAHSAGERLGFMREANKLADEQLKKDLKVAKEKLRFQVEENSYSKSTQQNLDDEAALKVAVFNLERSNFSERKRLKSEEQAIVKEIAAQTAKEEKERIASAKLDLEALTNWKLKRIEDETDAEFKIRIEAAKKLAKEQKELDKKTEAAKQTLIQSGFTIAAGLASKSEAAAKAVAVAKTIYNTQQAIMKVMADVPAPFNIPQAIATGIMGAQAVQKILSTSADSASAKGGAEAAASGTPAPRMMQGAFTLGGGIEPEPARAYVVSDDITNNQNKLAIIRRRATI